MDTFGQEHTGIGLLIAQLTHRAVQLLHNGKHTFLIPGTGLGLEGFQNPFLRPKPLLRNQTPETNPCQRIIPLQHHAHPFSRLNAHFDNSIISTLVLSTKGTGMKEKWGAIGPTKRKKDHLPPENGVMT
jgi:hypothetical protein